MLRQDSDALFQRRTEDDIDLLPQDVLETRAREDVDVKDGRAECVRGQVAGSSARWRKESIRLARTSAVGLFKGKNVVA